MEGACLCRAISEETHGYVTRSKRLERPSLPSCDGKTATYKSIATKQTGVAVCHIHVSRTSPTRPRDAAIDLGDYTIDFCPAA